MDTPDAQLIYAECFKTGAQRALADWPELLESTAHILEEARTLAEAQCIINPTSAISVAARTYLIADGWHQTLALLRAASQAHGRTLETGELWRVVQSFSIAPHVSPVSPAKEG